MERKHFFAAAIDPRPVSVFLAGLLASFASIGCLSAEGPPFPDAPQGELAPHPGPYRFDAAREFFDAGQLGEVYLEQTRGREPETLFTLRIYGRERPVRNSGEVANPARAGDIRVRQYEGRAAFLPERRRLELRSERCYLFGKAAWTDRLAPLQRWDCDHLVFAFTSANDFAARGKLAPVAGERTQHTDWFAPTTLHPLPSASSQAPHFAGQIYEGPLRMQTDARALRAPGGWSRVPTPEEEALPGGADAVVLGYGGARRLRDGNVLDALAADGRPAGRLEVIERPGDFILCRWISRVPEAEFARLERPLVAFTQRSQIPTGGLL